MSHPLLTTPPGAGIPTVTVSTLPTTVHRVITPVEIRPVRTRRALDDFVRLPWSLYRDDPQWVPPLLREVKQFLDPGHAFRRHGSAELLVAYRAGLPVGRILASDDPNFNAEHGTNLGSFGMFESIDDEHVATALLEAAADWLRARGRTAVRGPIDYSTNYNCGLLIEGFDTPPRVMMNHNPPYYADLFRQWGLAKAKDLYSWWFIDPYNMLDKWRTRAERIAGRGGVRVRSVERKDVTQEIVRCKQVYNQAWQRNWGFVRMTDAEFDHMARHLLPVIVPEMLLLAESEGQPVGFSLTLPDVNEAIRPLNGRLTRWGIPVGLWKLYRGLKRVRTARMVTLGVLDSHRRRGVAELLILRALEHGRKVLGYQGAELGWTLEDNELINRTIQAVGAQQYKTYRIFEKSI